jgi:hypothetical protein
MKSDTTTKITTPPQHSAAKPMPLHLTITRKEARLLEALLRPRAHLLQELLEVQVQALPPGDDSWTVTQDALRVANGALVKVRNAHVQEVAA